MEKDKVIVRPNASRMMESLRDTGYSFNDAIADIVDNSISAEADKIAVYLNREPDSSESKLYIADNGHGMNLDELKNAMKYGSDSSDSESHLNKFGFGLKTGSTAFCKKLSVLSKREDCEYHKVTWDLDHITSVNEWELIISEPNNDEIELLETITNGSKGTLVIWEKIDRLLNTSKDKATLNKAYNRIEASLKQHLSMVFQRFINGNDFGETNREIFVNDTKLTAYDPFFLSEPATKIVAKRKQEVILSDESRKYFDLKAVILPRQEDWTSNEAYKSAKISNPYEGIYVYRENRLIHYGDWLGMFVAESHVSLCRVELSFEHDLDDLFNVDIKKSKILLNEDIYNFLKENFLPAPRKEAIKVYNSAQARSVMTNNAKKGVHKLSNTTIDDKKEDIISSSVEVLNKATGEVNIKNQNGTAKGTLKILDIPEAVETKVIVEEKEDDILLWEPALVNNEHAVILNSKHPYYYKVYAKADSSNQLTAIDFLLWSLSEAELATYTESVKEQYKDMRIQVSSKLRKLVEALPEPEVVDK